MHAVRNIRLCTKDCLCLYVCPTGATDTETGQIDASKCLSGCRACVDACPSNAISLVPEAFPPQQKKTPAVLGTLRSLAASKTAQERIAAAIADTTADPVVKQLAAAVSMSNRLMAEDLLREAGYMLPQSQETLELLRSSLIVPQSEDFPKTIVEKLISALSKNALQEEQVMEKFRCSVCGYIHEGAVTHRFQMPALRQTGLGF